MSTYYILIGLMLCGIIWTMVQLRAARKSEIRELLKMFDELPKVKD
ncbi:MAG: hypothetical protein WBQ32_04080 [Ignavibacteriaceae bacterium]